MDAAPSQNMIPSDRRVSARLVSLSLLGPFLMVIANITINYWLGLRLVHDGYPPRLVSLVQVTFAVCYTLSSYLAGRYATRRHAAALLAGIVAVTGLLGIPAFLVDSFALMLVVAGVNGLLSGQYYVVFQFRMGHVRPVHVLAWSIALYNLSWASGDAVSPLVVAFLREHSAAWAIGVALTLAVIHLFLVWLSTTVPLPSVDTADSAGDSGAVPSTKEQRIVGWISVLAGVLIYTSLYGTLYAGLGNTRDWSDREIGVGLFVMSLPVLLGSPIWAWVWPMLRRPWGLAACLLLAAAGVVTLPLVNSWPMSLPGLFAVGCGFGAAMYHGIYYCNADPDDALGSVGINEAIVGAATLVGPLASGQVAWSDFTAPRTYVMLAATQIAVALYVLAYCRRKTV